MGKLRIEIERILRHQKAEIRTEGYENNYQNSYMTPSIQFSTNSQNTIILLDSELLGTIENVFPFTLNLYTESGWVKPKINSTTQEQIKKRFLDNFEIFDKQYKFKNMRRENVRSYVAEDGDKVTLSDIGSRKVTEVTTDKNEVETDEPIIVKEKKQVVKKTSSTSREKIGKDYIRITNKDRMHDAVIYLLDGMAFARDGATSKARKEFAEGSPYVGYVRVNFVKDHFEEVTIKEHKKYMK